MMTELFDYSCSHPSFHLEHFVGLQSEYDSESNVNLYFTPPGRYRPSPSRWGGNLPGVLRGLLSPRWPLGGARPQGWAASSRLLLSSVSIWSSLFCKHLQWLNLLLSVLHESLSSFLFFFLLQSVCLHFGIKAWQEGAAVKRSTEKHSDGHICYISPVGSQLKGCSRGDTFNLIQTFIFCSWFNYK